MAAAPEAAAAGLVAASPGAAAPPAPVQAPLPGVAPGPTPTLRPSVEPPPLARPLARTEKRAVLQSLEGRSRDEIRKTLSALRPDSGAARPRPRATWMGHQGEWRELRLHLSEKERIQLDRPRSLLSHRIPGGDFTEVVLRLEEGRRQPHVAGQGEGGGL